MVDEKACYVTILINANERSVGEIYTRIDYTYTQRKETAVYAKINKYPGIKTLKLNFNYESSSHVYETFIISLQSWQAVKECQAACWWIYDIHIIYIAQKLFSN